VFVLNTLSDLICDVISCYICSCDTGKIDVYDKIAIESKKNTESMEIKEICT